MKLKKEYTILIGIILVLLVYLIFSGGRSKMSYDVPRLAKLTAGEIDKIEISGEGETITLTGKEETWKILPQEYPADPVKIKDMLETVENLTLTELAAESEGYQRYDLHSDKKISVKVFKQDQLVRAFDIGKTPSTYRHTFVRLADDNRVFYARGSFRSHFDQEVKDLRNKIVMTFDRNEITGIDVRQEDVSLSLAKKMVPAATEADPKSDPPTEAETEGAAQKPPEPQEEEAWVLPDGTRGKKTDIDAIISELYDLRCDEFITDKSKEDYTTPIYTVTAKGTKDYTLMIFTKEGEDDQGKYPAMSSESPYLFLLSTYKAERIMKKPEDLKEPPAESPEPEKK